MIKALIGDALFCMLRYMRAYTIKKLKYIAKRIAGYDVARGELRILQTCAGSGEVKRYYLIDPHQDEITLLLFAGELPLPPLKNGSHVRVLGNYRGTTVDRDTGLMTRVFMVDPASWLAA